VFQAFKSERTQAHCGFQQPQYAHDICGAQDHLILGATLQFRRVLDDDQAMRSIDLGHVIEDRIRQCRLARARATDNKDILALANGTLDRSALRGRHDPGAYILIQCEHRGRLAPDGEHRARRH
jgi:hypothetical protein